jgi:S1-C subfamily serine protease
VCRRRVERIANRPDARRACDAPRYLRPLLLCALVTAIVTTCPPPLAARDDLAAARALVQADETARIDVLSRAARSVVCIFENREFSSGGSGVLIDPDGYGLTNFHVVASFVDSRRAFGGLSDGHLYPLRLLGIDPGGDIAMFKLDCSGRPASRPSDTQPPSSRPTDRLLECPPLGDAADLRVGQWVAAIGNPFLLAEDFTPTLTLGVVSGLHRYQVGQGNLLEYADCIQVSTSINPGNSGGPLFDLSGRVVGIVGRASFEERGRVNVGLGYAVTINQVRRFLPALRAGRLCEHGTLGATTELAGDDLIFNAIQDLSPAARAGIELGDVLLAISGRPVRTPNDYNNIIATLPADWPVTISLRRRGHELTVRTRLERLALRDIPLFVTDLELNQAEVRRAFALYTEVDRRGTATADSGVGRYGPARITGRVRVADAAVEFTWEPDGAARFNRNGDEMLRTPGASDWEFRRTDGSATGAWPDAQVWQEWTALVRPLISGPEIGIGWELRGGDEVNGRIVTVAEQRLDA